MKMKPAVKLKRLDQQKLSTNYTTVIHGHMDMHTANLWRPYVENVDKIFQEQKQVAQSDSSDLKSIFYQFKEKQAESNNNASYSNSLFFEWDLNV